MSSKELKPLILYLVRKGWNGQLYSLCDSIIAKKSKDYFAAFWRAYALGMTGNISDAMSQLESFQSRRDLQFPASLALIYFHKRLPKTDREAIESLRTELSVTRDVSVRSYLKKLDYSPDLV